MFTAMYIYVEQLILYIFGLYACFRQTVRFPYAQILGGIACFFLSLSTVPSHYFASYFCALAATFFSMRGKISQRFLQTGTFFIICAGISELVEIPRKYLFHTASVSEAPLFYFLEILVSFFIFSLILLFRTKMPEKTKMRLAKTFSHITPGLLFLTIFHLMLTIACLESLYPYVPSSGFRTIVLFLNGTSLFAVWVLSLLIFHIRETNFSLAEKEQQEKELRSSQKDYYELLLKQETDTRKYRHDLNNHLFCLSELCKKGNLPELQSYIDHMQTTFSKTKPKMISSENDIICALTTHILADLPPDVVVSYKESLTIPVAADSFRLCTIYSNLLKNAAEELKRCPPSDSLQLNILLRSGEKLFSIQISNSISSQNIDITKTRKKSSADHGFGLPNVRDAVSQLEGSISFEKKGSLFFVHVLLPNDNMKTQSST